MTPSPQAKTEAEGGSFLTKDPPKEGDKPPTEKKDETAAPEKKEGEGEGDKPAEGAPEKYADWKLPEGYAIDEAAGKEINELFRSMNLTQESGQKLVDYYAKNLLQAQEAPFKAWADTQKEWVSDIHERFGSKAEATRVAINSAITNALPPSLARAFRTALDITGAGSNPDVFEALSILAKPHMEGKSVPAGGPSGEANREPGRPAVPSAADAIYPHLVGNRQQ
jgi:hypothetical protein